MDGGLILVAFEFIIFDLAETIYPRGSGLMREVGRRIQFWLCNHMGLSWDEAITVRRDYFRRYGTTMGGLIAEHDMDVHDYLIFVHDIPVEQYLDTDPALAAMLDAIPLRKAVYTNATSEYARRVLRALGVVDRFDWVIGIEEVGLRNKIHGDAYEQALALLGVEGSTCIMVEDSTHNLRPAKALGLTTVLVGADSSAAFAEVSDGNVDFVVENVLEVGRIVNGLLYAAG